MENFPWFVYRIDYFLIFPLSEQKYFS